MCKNDRQKVRDCQKQYRENMTDEQKQKNKNNRKQYRENMTDEEGQKYKEAKNKRDRDRYNKRLMKKNKNIAKNIKTCQKIKNKKEEIIKNNI